MQLPRMLRTPTVAAVALTVLTALGTGTANAESRLAPRGNAGEHTGVTVTAAAACSVDFRVWLVYVPGRTGRVQANVEGRKGGFGLFTGSSATASCQAGVKITWRRVDASGNGTTGFLVVGTEGRADGKPSLQTVDLDTGSGAIDLTVAPDAVAPEQTVLSTKPDTKTYDVP